MSIFKNTICAPASAPGGAIAVIRVSGDEAIDIVDKIFVPAAVAGAPECQPQAATLAGSPECQPQVAALAGAKGYTMHFGTIVERRQSEGVERTIDQVVVSVFRAPASYTGENSVEISCHGSAYVVQEILSLLVGNGASMAAPGEFTQRAFVNGKMDLSQAEAVADLIASQTAAAHRVALNQLKGGFSGELSAMREELLKIVSLMELELDFSEEEVEFADRTQLRKLLDEVISHISTLIESFTLGNAIKNGVPVVIAGSTNAGKSTLLNAIIGESRAIVSDIAGTTRDTIEELYNIGGVQFRFIDTAGLRQSSDAVEKIGIERAYSKLSEASLVLAVTDLCASDAVISAQTDDILSRVGDGQNLVHVLNKADAVTPERIASVRNLIAKTSREPSETAGVEFPQFVISAKTGQGLPELLHHVASLYSMLDAASETTLVTNVRHLDALKEALISLQRVREALDTSLPTDLIAQDIREALYHLGTITGSITTDEVLGNIFSHFCIGK